MLDPRSQEKLLGVHPDLVHVFTEAANRTKFRITGGLRTRERQAILVSQRKSKTMNSRHLTGHAVDFVAIGEDGIATFDFADMARVADVIKAVAREKDVPVEWGGDWKGAWDTPHFQLPWKQYPAIGVSTTTRVVEAAKAPPAAATTGAAVGAGTVAVSPSLPDLPSPPDLSKYQDWMSFGDSVSALTSWVTGNLVVTGLCAVWLGAVWFWPLIKEKADALYSKAVAALD